MSDREMVLDILRSILTAIERITKKMQSIQRWEDFFTSEEKRDALDVLCMQLTALGEGLKLVDKLTENGLLVKYPQVDWKGFKGIRDVIAHQYFDISAEAVFDACRDNVPVLKQTIQTIIKDIS